MKILTSLIAVALLTTAGVTFAELQQGAYVIGASGGTVTTGNLSATMVVGESISGSASSGNLQLQAGFIPVYVHSGAILSAPEDDLLAIPQKISLSDAYPNPFNATTSFDYSIQSSALVSIAIFDVAGREVRRLTDGHQAAGNYRLSINAGGLSSGVYFLKLTSQSANLTSKLLLMK